MVKYSELLKKAFSKIKELNPMQKEALKKGVLISDKNVVVSSPTASGKTLIAEILFLREIAKGKKAIYVVPLRSLAMEKYEEFSKKYPEIRVALSIGDYDSDDPWLENYDLIVCTAEKFDSLLRHSPKWIKDVGIAILDEFHLLGDKSRGATFEVLTTKLLTKYKPRIVALSATMENADEIAKWLDAILVKSNWRPVEIKHLIYYNEKLINSEEITLDSKYKDLYLSIAEDTLKKGKQIIFFMTSRKKAENLAEKLSKLTKKFLTVGERELLRSYAKRIENVLETPTEQCLKLAELVRNGIAFHHAGLLNEQRAIIEKLFREGILKIICSTTTLAMGLNLPAYRVFIDIRRVGGWISPVEYHQMAGRAGRPGFEKEGQAITVARTGEDIERIREIYHSGKLNVIESALRNPSLFRMHILSIFAEKVVINRKGFEEFIKRTFFYFRNKDDEILKDAFLWIEKFKDWGFLREEDGFIEATKLGKRISELYIDPLTAKVFIDGYYHNMKEIEILLLISEAEELKPYPEVSIDEYRSLKNFLENLGIEINVDPWDLYEFFGKLKIAKIIYDWINEIKEKEIIEKNKIYPGDLRNLVTIFEWLLYSLQELLKVLGIDYKRVSILRKRVIHGVREELLPLVEVRHIGRVRARLLYNVGIRSFEELKNASLQRLKSLLGEKIGEKIYNEIHGKKKKIEPISLKDFIK